ncbi:hypothetical protein LX36DRAFT_233879 [Colletotrichum falcatum]|nr:hypothetical protein LX36DRAFT_233879 [Colletotrichum falcatum]
MATTSGGGKQPKAGMTGWLARPRTQDTTRLCRPLPTICKTKNKRVCPRVRARACLRGYACVCVYPHADMGAAARDTLLLPDNPPFTDPISLLSHLNKTFRQCDELRRCMYSEVRYIHCNQQREKVEAESGPRHLAAAAGQPVESTTQAPTALPRNCQRHRDPRFGAEPAPGGAAAVVRPLRDPVPRTTQRARMHAQTWAGLAGRERNPRNSINRVYRQAADSHPIRGARAENSNWPHRLDTALADRGAPELGVIEMVVVVVVLLMLMLWYGLGSGVDGRTHRLDTKSVKKTG